MAEQLASSEAGIQSSDVTYEPPTVVVVGGGLAGMVASLRLAEAGCRVTLLEAEPYLGGKVVGYIDSETGEAREHSMRVYMDQYRTLLNVLQESEATHSGRSARSMLRPVQMDYLPDAQSPPLRALSLFKHYGITMETLSLGTAITHSTFFAENHNMNMDEWFEKYDFSPEMVEFANAVMGVWTGAKPRSRASSILGSLYIVLLSMFSPPKEASWAESAFRFTAMGNVSNQLLMAYPTGASTIEPIRRRLVSLGVHIRTGIRVCEVITMQAPPSAASSSESSEAMLRASQLNIQDAETGESLGSVEADAIILAVDTAAARRLYPPAFAVDDREHDLEEGFGEWSVGCCLPVYSAEDLPQCLWTPQPAPRMVMDSPWHITYCVVGRDAFLGTPSEKPSSAFTIFATGSNLEDSPGRRFGKTALMCNPREFKLEYLEQIGISDELAEKIVDQGSVGLGVEYLSRADIAAKPWKYTCCSLGPEQDDPEGHRWVNRSLLFIETKDDPIVSVFAPGCENLFLAGEYISSKFTTIKVPTMEKSAETGDKAADAAMRWLLRTGY